MAAILTGWVILKLNFASKGYVSRQSLDHYIGEPFGRTVAASHVVLALDVFMVFK